MCIDWIRRTSRSQTFDGPGLRGAHVVVEVVGLVAEVRCCVDERDAFNRPRARRVVHVTKQVRLRSNLLHKAISIPYGRNAPHRTHARWLAYLYHSPQELLVAPVRVRWVHLPAHFAHFARSICAQMPQHRSGLARL